MKPAGLQASVGRVAASLEAELGTLNDGLQRRQAHCSQPLPA